MCLLQMSLQQPANQAATSHSLSGPRHGATTITDPVQMMWQQQQIHSPLTPSHPAGPTTSPSQKSTLQQWPQPEPVASPSRRRQKLKEPHVPCQHSHSHQSMPPQLQASFQPFHHSLLPQLRTSTTMPSSPASSSSLPLPPHSMPGSLTQPHSGGGLPFPPGVPASLGFPSDASMPAPPPSLPQTTTLAPHFSAPFSLGPMPHSPSNSTWGSARGSLDGYTPPAEEPGNEALSTFHLPEGLAEQLSTSQPLPTSPPTLQPPWQPASQASDAQLHHQHSQQQEPGSQAPQLRPQSGRNQPKPKLTSPPGFARRLDGAAKPFIPGRPMSAGSETSQQQQVQGAGSSVPWNPTARHMRPPPGMGGAAPPAGRSAAYSDAPSSPGYLAGQQSSVGNGRQQQQPANLASGQWALANGTGSAGPILGSPFSQSLNPSSQSFGAEAQSTMSNNMQWQVPDTQLAQSGLQYGKHAAACVLDTDQHETSGLAPNDVLDFLGIGSDEHHISDASQSERHHSQGLSSNGDNLHSPWLNK